jgi:hypothetical protein
MSFSGLRRGERKKNAEKMYSSIAADKLTDKFGTIIKKHLPHQRGQRSSRPAKKLKIDVVDMDNESDPNDGQFVSDESSSESEDGDTEIDDAQPLNAEVFSLSSFQSSLTLYRLRISSLQRPFQLLDVDQESERGIKLVALLLKTGIKRLSKMLKTRTAHKI